MSGTFTVGSFYNTRSPLHAMDPRAKIVITIVLMVVASRVPVRLVARACKPLLIFVAFTALMNVIAVRSGNPVFHLFSFAITDEALWRGFEMSFRVFALMMAGVVFSLTTSPVAITDGAEWLLAPLARLGVPTHELATMFTIAIRFVPTLANEARLIMAAQTARGANLDEGGLVERVKAFVPVLVPLFASALRHAEELGDAMEARCYAGGQGRTHYHVLKLRRPDWIAIAILAAYLLVLLTIRLWA